MLTIRSSGPLRRVAVLSCGGQQRPLNSSVSTHNEENRILRVLLGISLLYVAATALGAERAERLQALMEAQGLTGMFEQQIKSGRENAQRQSDQMLTQLLTGLNPPEQYRAKLKDAAEKFIEDARSPLTAKDIVAEWSELYGSKFTDAELDQLLAFYTSPLAQREVVATKESLEQMSTRFQEQYRPVMESATKAFVERLQAIVKECNCRK